MKTQGEIEAVICEGVSRFEQDYMGRGPKDIHAHLIGDLLVIRYADLRTETKTNLLNIMSFLGVDPAPQVIEAAVNNNNVQNMRKKEEQTPQIGYDPRTKSIAEEKRFVRSGVVGAWRERLTPMQVSKVEQRASAMLARLGFENQAVAVPQRAASSAD